MTQTEKKKILYKEKPIAELYHKGDHTYYYITRTSEGDIEFKVPTSEMGETIFKDEEQAQFLIRWMI